MTSAANGVRTGIEDTVSGLNSLLGAINDFNNKLPSFIPKFSIPTIPQPSLDALSNIQFPTTIQDSLTKLNSSIPSLDQIRGAIDDV